MKSYLPDMPSKEDVDKVIEAGLAAASGRNLQASVIIAVTNKEIRDKLAAANAAVMGAGAWAVYGLAARFIGIESWLKMAVCMMAAVAVAVVIYLVAVICLKVITKEDMNLIPGGGKLAKLLHMR